MKRAILFLVLVFILSLSARAELNIGASSADFTPDVNKMRVTTGGYGKFLGHSAKRVHDPVYAKAVVFESEGKKVALVAIDLVEVSNEIMDAVYARLKGTEFGRENLFVSATHTHSAPGAVENIIVADFAFGPYNQKIVDMIADAIVKAIKDANANLKPATLSIAQGEKSCLTRNRRVPYYNYDTRRFSKPCNPETEPITDDAITVLRADDKNGKPIVIIVHFATHATTLGPATLGEDNVVISADWPGVMRREIEAKYPGALVMYINGAEGDQAPDEADIPDDFEAMEIFGKRVAEVALPLIEKTVPIKTEPLEMKISIWKVDRGAQAFGVHFPEWLTKIWFKEMPFSALRLGDLILLGAPLEAISEIGQAIKKNASELGYKYPIYVGMVNDHYLYLTTPEEFKKGGYEAGNTMFGESESEMVISELKSLSQELLK